MEINTGRIRGEIAHSKRIYSREDLLSEFMPATLTNLEDLYLFIVRYYLLACVATYLDKPTAFGSF